MPHIVTDHCVDCRYTLCVETCPVDCFHAADTRLYIDPEVCIDCGACVSECPVGAITDSFDLGDEGEPLVELNRRMAMQLPIIDTSVDPLPTAEAKKLALGR